MFIATHALDDAVYILHKLLLKNIYKGHYMGILQPNMVLIVEIQVVITIVRRQLILIVLTCSDM